MKKLAALLLLVGFLAPALPHAAAAQDWHRDRHWHGDIHHFRDRDLGYWHSGHWFHGPHGGRSGWWWILGSSYYFYPAPVYPYPDPFIPPVGSPVVAPAPVVGDPAFAPAPVAASYLYYCRHPRGYYPYVAACARPWRLVPAY